MGDFTLGVVIGAAGVVVVTMLVLWTWLAILESADRSELDQFEQEKDRANERLTR